MAIPNAIERPAGKFILVLVSKSADAPQSFQLDPGAVAEKILGPNPLLKVEGGNVAQPKRKIAYLVDLPAGEFHLKTASTGMTLCKVTGK